MTSLQNYHGRIKIMKQVKYALFLLLMMSLLMFLVACSDRSSSDDQGNDESQTESSQETNENDEDANEEENKASGGVLHIAINAAPPTLDQPTSTATASRDATRLIFESLVATDSEFRPVPVLAESIETDDNQTYVFKLRQGIKFHNGKEMTAEDVVASMYRWMEKSTVTGNVFNDATWTAEDDYTVVLELAAPSTLTLDTMASAKQAAGIMPKEVIEAATAEGVQEFIGTGPYKLVEWKQDQYIHYERYEDYQPVDMEPDGLIGRKEALVDEIYIHIVPDTSTRLAGLQSGEYDFIYGVPFDNYDQLVNDPNFETLLTPSSNHILVFNKVEGISTNFKLRQAINTGLNADDIMMAAFPNKDFYWLDSGYMDVNIVNWASTAGSEYYNQNDMEKAKQMLQDMGYNGEEFRLMATRDYDHHYNSAVVIYEQLKEMGINASLEIYDWPTLNDKMDNDLGAWDAFVTSSSTVSTPPQLIALSPSFGGGVNDQKVIDLMKQIENAPTIEEAQALWDELQLYAWEELLPIVNLGGFNALYAYSNKIEGVTATTGPIFWNVSKSE